MLNNYCKHIFSTIIFGKSTTNFIYRIYISLTLNFFLFSFIKNYFILKIRTLAKFLPK